MYFCSLRRRSEQLKIIIFRFPMVHYGTKLLENIPKIIYRIFKINYWASSFKDGSCAFRTKCDDSRLFK